MARPATPATTSRDSLRPMIRKHPESDSNCNIDLVCTNSAKVRLLFHARLSLLVDKEFGGRQSRISGAGNERSDPVHGPVKNNSLHPHPPPAIGPFNAHFGVFWRSHAFCKSMELLNNGTLKRPASAVQSLPWPPSKLRTSCPEEVPNSPQTWYAHAPSFSFGVNTRRFTCCVSFAFAFWPAAWRMPRRSICFEFNSAFRLWHESVMREEGTSVRTWRRP
jgi:hypothetical protein